MKCENCKEEAEFRIGPLGMSAKEFPPKIVCDGCAHWVREEFSLLFGGYWTTNLDLTNLEHNS